MEVDQPIERPRTSRGRYGRSMRPPSRGGRKIEQLIDDEEGSGRPASRRGFTPETYERHDYDEFSRQQLPTNRPCSPSYSSSPSPPPVVSQNQSRPMSRGSPQKYRTPVPPSHTPQRPSNHRPLSRGSSRDHVSPSQQIWNVPNDANLPYSRASPAYRRTSEDSSSRHSWNRDQHHQEDIRHQYHQEDLRDQYHQEDLRDQYRQEDLRDQYRQEDLRDQYRQEDLRDQYHQEDLRDQYPQEDLRDQYPQEDTRDHYHQEDLRERYNQEDIRSPSWQDHHSENRYSQDFSQTDHHMDVLSLDRVQQENWPMTPREKPPTSRPKSSKKRLKSSRRKRQEQMTQHDDTNSVHSAVDTPILRPPSSLSKYRLLPAIGQSASKDSDCMDGITSQTQNLSLGLGERTRTSYSIDLHKNEEKRDLDSRISDTDNSIVSRRNSETIQDVIKYEEKSNRKSFDLSSSKSTFKSHDLPDEPNDTEARMLLAIRLPDGKRHQRYFRVTDKLEMVLKFAENISYMDLTGQRLACNAPRVVFTDLSMLIGESGLEDRTVLYLEEEE